jgi:site-specific recombinase XerD
MWQQYDKAVKIVLDYLVERGFRRTPREEFRRAAREFRRYLESIPREYSHTAAQSWLEAIKPSVPRLRYLSLRRSLALVDEAARNGSVSNTQFSYDDAPIKYRVPGCFKQLLAAYVERRKQDGCQRSTLCMASNACTRFLLFLQSRNITEVTLISPEVVKEYQAQTEHRTVEGKNAYICAVRRFVRFLVARKLVPETLEFAFATEKAPRSSIVTTMSKQQTESIRLFAERSRTASQLRNAAMTMLALRMGFRSIDICNLRLSDICWKSRTISIVQRKTGAPLTLPFPVEVGNLLARYITEARPECDEPGVFVKLRHPYTKLRSSTSCYASSLVVLGRKTTQAEVRGLHVARRTFASNLLRAGNPVSTISSTLGHTTEEAVNRYLATDGEKMRQCGIGLSGIEIKEGL